MIDIYNSYSDKAYRFLTFEGLLKTLEDDSLRLTRADNFNDPLDNSPLIAPFEWREFKKMGYNYINTITEYSFNKIFSSTYICCFSKEYDNENSYLMWSHYSDSHKGVCFEIDFSKNIDLLDTPSNVEYPDDLLSVRENLRITKEQNVGLFLVTNKLKVWKYEKEVRIIVDIENEKFDSSSSKISTNLKHLFYKI